MIVTSIRTRVIDVPLNKPFSGLDLRHSQLQRHPVVRRDRRGIVGEDMVATFNRAWLANFVQLITTMAPPSDRQGPRRYRCALAWCMALHPLLRPGRPAGVHNEGRSVPGGTAISAQKRRDAF
jgi:hypothetical protein